MNTMVWQWGPCADWYNVYRRVDTSFIDADNNGVADDYGPCFQPNLVLNQVPDSSVPAAGIGSFYLVSGESTVGEGTIGFASNGGMRPNVTPCP